MKEQIKQSLIKSYWHCPNKEQDAKQATEMLMPIIESYITDIKLFVSKKRARYLPELVRFMCERAGIPYEITDGEAKLIKSLERQI